MGSRSNIQYPRLLVFETCHSTTVADAKTLPKGLRECATSSHSPIAGLSIRVAQICSRRSLFSSKVGTSKRPSTIGPWQQRYIVHPSGYECQTTHLPGQTLAEAAECSAHCIQKLGIKLSQNRLKLNSSRKMTEPSDNEKIQSEWA